MGNSMIQVVLGNNVNKTTVTVDSNRTLRDVLEENHIDYSRGTMTLDGSPLQAGAMDKTFAEMGITTKCYLLSVTKADNALAA